MLNPLPLFLKRKVMLLALLLCSCASVETTVKRSEYSGDIWIIESVGNNVTFSGAVLNDAKKQAAEKSNMEGMNCFVAYKDRIYDPLDGFSLLTFSYEDTSVAHSVIPRTSLYVSFHKYDECKNFEITKGKDKVFYNNETIENAKSVENGYLVKEILVWAGSIAFCVAFYFIIQGATEEQLKSIYN
ncbi:hypothetical protein R83H12_01607 [Fibrobacteria bacterium R8-3-H12]